jgi:hypothetical protein
MVAVLKLTKSLAKVYQIISTESILQVNTGIILAVTLILQASLNCEEL